MLKTQKLYFPLLVSIIAAALLSAVQLMSDSQLILLERLMKGGGWLEIVLLSIYAAILGYNMSDPSKQAKWRIRSWTIFSVFFFIQLIMGLVGFEKFLMSGELHLPVPMMIVAGPVYRLEISFMPVLFLSTVVLSGPAWCSQLCYFGAIDAKVAASRKTGKTILGPGLKTLKFSVLIIVILSAVLLRLFEVSTICTTLAAGLFGIIGLLLILLFSGKKGKMVNCIAWCPVGTVVNYLKYINPFRFRIADSCTSCMRCIPVCRYDALTPEKISQRKPGNTCTLCGDCIRACKPGSLHYKFPGLAASSSRRFYLGITIVLHTIFLALARM